MFRLFLIIYSLAGTALAGTGVIAVLTMNMFDVKSVVIAALAGAIVGLPVAWMVAKRISEA